MVETAKRILTKEKLDRQLTRQSSSTPLMSIRNSHNRNVSFGIRDELGDKIDKLAVMLGKLPQEIVEHIDNSNHKSIKVEVEVKMEIKIREMIRTGTDQITDQVDVRGQYRLDRSRPRSESNLRRGNFRGYVRNYGRQNSRGEYKGSYRNDSYDRSGNRSRDRLFSRNYGKNRTRSICHTRSRSGSRDSTTWDRICCYTCREYHHFARDCPTSREEKEIEQFQQMLNLEDEQTVAPCKHARQFQ